MAPSLGVVVLKRISRAASLNYYLSVADFDARALGIKFLVNTDTVSGLMMLHMAEMDLVSLTS